MRKLVFLFGLLFAAISLQAQTVPSSVVFPTTGLVLQVNTPFTVTFPTVTYPDTTTDTTCTTHGNSGFTWASPTPALQPANSGSFNNGILKWSSSYDPHNTAQYPFGFFTALGVVKATCNGVSDVMTMLAQSTVASHGSLDTYTMYISPAVNFFQDTLLSNNIAPTLAVGATMQVGLGVVSPSGGNANPAQITCTWSSSNTGVATVNRYGLATAVAPGQVQIACTQNGNGAFATYTNTNFYGHNMGGTAGSNFWEFTVVSPTITNNTYYVRTDGGTPWVNGTLTPFGQCTGLGDFAYPGTTNAFWVPLTSYSLGTVITANNGHYQTVTTAGTSGTVSNQEPTWTGTTTTDGTVTWTQGGTYPVQQSCGIQNFRDLWTDHVSGNHVAWMINGGDTVIVRKPVSGFYSSGYFLGPDVQSPTNTGTAGAKLPLNCAGDPQDCYMPPIPSGSAARHTKIYGENAADFTGTSTSCRTDAAKTNLLGTWAIKNAVNARDSQFVDFECFRVSQVAQCAHNGNYTNNCTDSAVASTGNYVRNGLLTSAMTSHAKFQDLLIEGVANNAQFGGLADSSVVFDHVRLRGAPEGGINTDDSPNPGGSNFSVAGGITFTNSITEFIGCVEEKPIVHNYPYIECRGQQTGAGAPDGLGTGATSGSWIFDHDIWRYNYQDGLDLLHSGLQVLSVTNSQSYGNNGNNYKIGSAASVTFIGNSSMTNCNRLTFVIGDEPASAVAPGEGPCRAGGGLNFHLYAYGTYLFQNNTVTGYPDVQFGFSCEAGSEDCHTANTVMQNNIFLGMTNTTQANGNPASLCPANMPLENDCNGTNSLYPANQGWATRDHNFYYNTRTCPTSLNTGEVCTAANDTGQVTLFTGQPANLHISTGSVGEGVLDNFFNPVPTGSSLLLAAGITYSGITVDMNGNGPTSPPVIGALNLPGAPTVVSIAVTPNPGSVGVGSTLTMTCTATLSDSTTAACTSPVWSDTNAHSSINTSTGVVTGASVGSDTITAVASSFTSPGVTVNITAVANGSFKTLGHFTTLGNFKPF